MNYNHLDGQEGRALNNNYRRNYGEKLALLP